MRFSDINDIDIYDIRWLRPNLSNYWNVEIVKYIKQKDIFRRGSSLEVSDFNQRRI